MFLVMGITGKMGGATAFRRSLSFGGADGLGHHGPRREIQRAESIGGSLKDTSG